MLKDSHEKARHSNLHGNCRIVTPLLGFAWGFHVADNGDIALKPNTVLTVADWELHLPYLRSCYAAWRFTEMQIRTDAAST